VRPGEGGGGDGLGGGGLGGGGGGGDGGGGDGLETGFSGGGDPWGLGGGLARALGWGLASGRGCGREWGLGCGRRWGLAWGRACGRAWGLRCGRGWGTGILTATKHRWCHRPGHQLCLSSCRAAHAKRSTQAHGLFGNVVHMVSHSDDATQQQERVRNTIGKAVRIYGHVFIKSLMAIVVRNSPGWCRTASIVGRGSDQAVRRGVADGRPARVEVAAQHVDAEARAALGNIPTQSNTISLAARQRIFGLECLRRATRLEESWAVADPCG